MNFWRQSSYSLIHTFKGSYRSLVTSESIRTRPRMINSQCIELTETETNIKNLLVTFCNHYNESAKQHDQLELRITGGWVRDKLLGKQSHDIDVAVNVLSGEEFATKLLEFAKANNIISGQSAGLHTIKKNPEKSKHLETCTTKIFGLDIDFVNLRNEQYTDESRVPIIECGTAEEDALRRDATLNALFYNLNKNEIEDFTGKGLIDLENGILRTPLQPLQTFLDDPLRVLRLIRFACRFDFTIEENTLEAMKDERMRTTLIHKISRERVGVEMDKILTSDNVQYGLHLINHVFLTDSIFNSGVISDMIYSINDQKVLEQVDACRKLVPHRIEAATQLFDGFYNFVKSSNAPLFTAVVKNVMETESTQKLFWLCAVLQPYGAVSVKINPKKASSMSYVEVVLKEGLRFGKQDYDTATNIIVRTFEDSTLGQFFTDASSVKRSDFGLYIRQFESHFNLTVVYNAFNDYLNEVQVADRGNPQPTQEAVISDIPALTAVVRRYEHLLAAIVEQGLTEVATMKPIIDGKVISRALDRKPGPWMRDITHEVLRWQLENPQGTQDECIAVIREMLQNTK